MPKVAQIRNCYEKKIDPDLEPGHWGAHAKEQVGIASTLRGEVIALVPNAQGSYCGAQFKMFTT